MPFLTSDTAAYSHSFRRWGVYIAALIAALVGGLLITRVSNEDRIVAALALLLAPIVLKICKFLSWRERQSFMLSPAGVTLSYLWVSILVVPVLWGLGLATPWDDVRSSLGLVSAGVVAVMALTVGVGLAGRGSQIKRMVVRGGRLTLALGLALVLGASGLFTLAVKTGGLLTLLTSLATRRDALSGLGPLAVLTAISGAAVFLAILSERRTFLDCVMAFGCGVLYVTYLFVSGSRFLMVSYLAAILIVRAHRTRISWMPLVSLLVLAMPFSVWYAYAIRQKLSYGVSEGSIGGDSVSAAVRSVVDPFVEGGLDALRTLGVTMVHPKPYDLNWEAAAGGVLTLVPRSIWPSKPYGVSITFSKEYFPDRWSVGTGVPPSLPAEINFYVGYVLAPLVLIVAGYLIARASQWVWLCESIWGRILAPFLTMDVVVLVKSGSDSFLRIIFIHGIAALLVGVAARSLGMTIVNQRECCLNSSSLKPVQAQLD